MSARISFRGLLRVALALPTVALAHAAGFAFAHIAQRAQVSGNPFFAGVDPQAIFPAYAATARAALNGDLGALPGATGRALGPELAQATLASLALLLAAFAMSAIAGIWLGRRSVRADPPAVRARLVGPASIGVALPAFYVGAALIAGAILLATQTDRAIVVPTVGLNLGWPMLLPIAALALRPTLQLALFSAGLLAAEAGKPYARAARSLGFDWRALQGRLLFRNTLLPIAAFLAASFRVIVAELVVVEWLFEWPGIGRLLALALVPARFSTAAGQTTFLLLPPLLAGLFAILAGLFVTVDAISALASQRLDPRIQSGTEKP